MYDLPLSWVPIPFLFGSDRTLPIFKPPSLRRLQRVYFAFGEPIDTARYSGDVCRSNLLEVRDAAQAQVLNGIHFLDELRQDDSHRWVTTLPCDRGHDCVSASLTSLPVVCLRGHQVCIRSYPDDQHTRELD